MKNISLNKQIMFLFFASIIFTILFAFFFIHYLYSELYIKSIEESIVYEGKRTASHYHYGELNDEIIKKVQWYNIVSEYEIIVVDNLEELSSYFPYKINYGTLVDEADQEQLEQGKYVMKEGYVEEFKREIVGAIFPIKGEEGLIGFIYIYVPLAAVQDVFSESIPILAIVGILFFFILFIIVNRIWKSMFKPLENLQRLSKEVSKGNYSNQLTIEREDEIGQLTKAFNQMNRSLTLQEERKKEFTSNLVHELRTPLTYISGYTEVLKEKIFTHPEEANSYLSTIEKETHRLNKLINDLVELNHLQEDMYKMDIQPIAVAQLLFDTIDLFYIHMTHKKIQMDTNVKEDLIILGDAKRIHQVFYNTIDNAVKYAEIGGTITIELFEKEDNCLFRINNDGINIHANDIERIGERFFRTDKARNRQTGGTGLGLSIVKEIVRLHHGTFTILSEEKAGTTVLIQFPSIYQEEDEK